MIRREDALQLVEKNVRNKNLIYHMFAVEGIMRGLARHFGEDVELWGLTGLLHDIDYSHTEKDPEKHTVVAEELLKDLVPGKALRAIKAHNSEHTGVAPESMMEKALVAADSLSGLLVACALVQPSKQITDVKPKSVKKKFKQKDFARAVSRERILKCEEIGLERPQFYEISLESLKEIAKELGL
jgi:putative nucleotidyltransferase with HDIG domain